jgi:circadian clock protein KaiC
MGGERSEGGGAPTLARFATRVPGLDRVLNGGFFAGGAYLIAGPPGTGKTTIGSQMVFAHAASGGVAIFATLLAETHDRMLANLRGYRFVDDALLGERVHVVSLTPALEEGGLDGLLAEARRLVRERRASLLVVDGTAAAEELAPSSLAYARFAQQLQAQSTLLGCTTLLLANRRGDEIEAASTNVDGVLLLARERVDGRALRSAEVTKLRGSAHLGGAHDLAITADGVAIFPRLEAAFAGTAPPALPPRDRLALDVPGLDAMLGGGLLAGSSTVIFGTPGAGKTLVGLHFAVAGARRGESVLVAAFRETAEDLAATAGGIGLELGDHVRSGSVRVLWRTPLELSPDAWAWEVLRVVEEQRPRRLVVDALTDVATFLRYPERLTTFTTALTNQLRALGVTSLLLLEIDAIVGRELVLPLPAASAAMDNGVLLRSVELESRLRRIVSVLKSRQSAFDPSIREFVVGEGGVAVGDVFAAVAGLLTGDVRLVRSSIAPGGESGR